MATLSATDVSLIRELSAVFPADRLLHEQAALVPYESDGLTVFRAHPSAVVLPTTQEEVIAAVRICHRNRVPFLARGSGTSLSGGSLPVEGGVIIGMNRMNRILDYRPEERVIVVEPGVLTNQVSRCAAADGLYYAPDPSSAPVCTIGGNVAFNAGGAHCLKHGMTANHVLGVKVALPDGTIAELGGPSLDAVGPGSPWFFVGSEGLFGVALEVTLRLLPLPERFHTVLAAYDSMQAAGDAVTSIVKSGLLCGAIEIMDSLSIQAVEVAVHAGYPTDAAAALIVELEGPAEEVEADIPRLDAVLAASNPKSVMAAKDADQRARIWKGRKAAFSAVGRLSADFIVQDGVVPRTRLGEALAEIDRLADEYGLRVANVFHAGDGNLHPLILFDARSPGGLAHAEKLAGEI
ncbi:MAG: FAD-binding protein, partial [Planctomycetales bacterium]|nr:FAD-binding protein [Planctomycetales bacterium]